MFSCRCDMMWECPLDRLMPIAPFFSGPSTVFIDLAHCRTARISECRSNSQAMASSVPCADVSKSDWDALRCWPVVRLSKWTEPQPHPATTWIQNSWCEYTNGTSFYYDLEAGTCRKIAFPVGILRPDWLSGATYLVSKKSTVLSAMDGIRWTSIGTGKMLKLRGQFLGFLLLLVSPHPKFAAHVQLFVF